MKHLLLTFAENFIQQIAREVYRTLSNIYEGALLLKSFWQKKLYQMFDRFLNLTAASGTFTSTCILCMTLFCFFPAYTTAKLNGFKTFSGLSFGFSLSHGLIHLLRMQNFRKTDICYPLTRKRTCTCQKVRDVTFSKNFAYVLGVWFLPWIMIQPFELNPLSANPQNGQIHPNSSSAIWRRTVWVCLTILLCWRSKG